MQRFTYLIFLLVVSCSSGQISTYPSFEAEPTTENIFGVEVVDTYRNMEAVKDSSVITWFKEQERLASSILDTLTEVSEFKNDTKDANNKTLSWANKVSLDEKGRMFYTRQPENEYPFKLFTADQNGKNERLLLNPEQYRPDKGKYKIDFLRPSWDGKYVAVSLSRSGDFSSELFVLERSSGGVVSDTLQNVAPGKFLGIQWLPDNSGFSYLYFPVVKNGSDGFKQDSYSRLHTIGQMQEEDPNIFGKDIGIPIEGHLFPTTKICSSESKYIFGHFGGAAIFYDTYYASIESISKGKPEWKYMYSADEKILGASGELVGKKYYYQSSKTDENYGIYYVNMNEPDFTNPYMVVKGHSRLVIDNFVPTQSGIYYTTYENGVRAELQFKNGGGVKTVSIPVNSGRIKMKSQVNVKDDDILIETEGWATDLMRYKVSKGKVSKQIILAPIPLYPEFESLQVEEIEIIAHDGELVPVSLVYNSNNTRDKSNMPTLLTAYGAYGNDQSPYFSPTRLTWVAKGGMLAIAHVRGGGEKGQDWHDAGRKDTKENSWKDLISVAEYIIEEGYTNPDSIALYGRSAGAITCGMAINIRPDLFTVFIGDVPYLNPVRATAGSYKKSSYLEFGDIENSKEAPYLIGMDPYLNIKDKTDYPAVMLSPSAKDNRLDLWESGKYIARLQKVSTSGNPILLDVQANAGHSGSSRVRTSRLMGFAWWQINRRK